MKERVDVDVDTAVVVVVVVAGAKGPYKLMRVFWVLNLLRRPSHHLCLVEKF